MRFNRIILVLTMANLALFAFLAVRGSAGNAAPALPTTLRAELIELVDADGRARAQLKTEADGKVVMRLWDRHGDIRVDLGASEFGAGWLLGDDRAEVGVHILAGISRLTRERATMITLADADSIRVVRPGNRED